MTLTARRIVAAAATAGLLLGAPAVAAAASGDTSDRGRLVSAERIRGLSAPDAATTLTAAGFDAGTTRYGVDAYRLVYRTVDPRGRPTTASGLLVLPRSGTRELRIVSYAHGSEVTRTDAPSVSGDAWAWAPALTYASAGFAAVAPDYLGLGLGPGPHPWMHVPSETTASLDMLRAARGFVPRTGRVLGRQVYVTGFSQGATAALGLARTLRDGAEPWFRVTAVAPISGAYALRQVELPALVEGGVTPPWSVAYTAYLLVAWNRLYHLYDSPGEVFNAPYDRTIEALFDGEHSGDEVFRGLPTDPGDPAPVRTLLTPYAMDLLRQPTGPLAAALDVHDRACDRAPRVPVRLYLSGDDEQVPAANAERCRDALDARHADVRIVDLGHVDHQGSRHLGTNVRGVAETVRWFGSLA